MPISHSPTPIRMPKPALIRSWFRKPAEPAGGVVERRGRALQVVGSGQPDQTVAQILALDQDEDHENDDDARGRQRRYQGRNQRSQALKRARIGLQHFTGTGVRGVDRMDRQAE